MADKIVIVNTSNTTSQILNDPSLLQIVVSTDATDYKEQK